MSISNAADRGNNLDVVDNVEDVNDDGDKFHSHARSDTLSSKEDGNWKPNLH